MEFNKGICLEFGIVSVNYNRTQTTINLPIAYNNTYQAIAQNSGCAVSGVCAPGIPKDASFTLTSFKITGDYSSDVLLNNPTYWFTIGY